jgi:hypothetical protein
VDLPNDSEGNRLTWLLPLAGLLSGLLTSLLLLPNGDAPFAGIFFGLSLAGALALSGILDSISKGVGLTVVTTVAYWCADFVAFAVQLHFRQIVPVAERWDMGTSEPGSAGALFVGGLVGGLIVFGALVLLFRPGVSKGALAVNCLFGALLGGGLAVSGWALRSSVGAGVWRLFHAFHLTHSWEQSPRQWFHGEYDYGESSRMYSLFVVWQTGVAAAAGFVFRIASKAASLSQFG